MQAGVKTTAMRLADHDVRGNGHMMMIEKNNLQIAALLLDWLSHTVVAER